MKSILSIQGKNFRQLLLLLAGTAGFLFSAAQKAKGPLQLADQYFAAGEYYTAANLYEQYLNPSKKQVTGTGFPLNSKRNQVTGTKGISRADILFKQAESYRLSNHWTEASAAYSKSLEKDSLKYADALYWRAVCERSLGNYDNAWQSLGKFMQSGAPGNSLTAAAKKERETLQYIQQQLSRADSVLVSLQKLAIANSFESGGFAPAYAGGNQFLISSTNADPSAITGVNPYKSRLYFATLNNGSMDDLTPVIFPSPGNSDNQGAATVSTDGKTLYFSQWKKVNGRVVSSIYYSTKQGTEWRQPQLLSSVNAEGSSNKQPFCSADGKYLFFASDRTGGSGKFDIWYAPLKSDGTTGTPVNAGTAINTAADEQAPFYQASSGTLVFSSNGRQGMGGYDLYSATGKETSWQSPENLGHPVNSSRDDIYFYAPEKSALLSKAIFSSDRGNGCCLETYAITKTSRSKTLAGVLKDCNDKNVLAGTEVIMTDKSGKNWTTTTDEQGRYQFSLATYNLEEPKLTFRAEGFNQMTYAVNVINTDGSDLLVEKMNNQELCLDKKQEEKLVIKAEDVVTVYFDFDRSILKADAISRLDSIYTMMQENPVITIQISGYTDGRGTVEYNDKLSDRRARACAQYLIKKGIDENRIRFVSFGSCCPVEMELINGRDNADGRSKNRRALINVKKD
jgi:OmpA-OmpF porin, OOP family